MGTSPSMGKEVSSPLTAGVAGRKEQFLSKENWETLDPMRLVATVPIRTYHTIADLWCGKGYFTLPFAKYLFDGKVYALDPSPEHLEALRAQLQAVHLTNVEVVQSASLMPPLKPESVDGVLLFLVLTEVADKEGLLREAAQVIRRGGWAAVLEWQKREGQKDGPPLEERLSEDEVLALAQKVGFRASERRDVSSRHYLLILRK
ncbi:MAG: class I SAM-dependent methyltransferase [Dehalococcoidia bacterium]|nr:class I SAM-dependent methyltransferase [Dehalococcoidia bacterium]MDW8120064.1 class I SAM-dependent methyltransferase [Chloroflexota bacterium]